MKVLCFGTYAKVLRFCCRGYRKGNLRNRNNTVPQRVLVGELLNAIDSQHIKGWTEADNATQLARKLIRCEQNIPDELLDAVNTVQVSTIADYIKKIIISLLAQQEIAVLAIRDIIEHDVNIKDSIIDSRGKSKSHY